jgi:hypothetical protein
MIKYLFKSVLSVALSFKLILKLSFDTHKVYLRRIQNACNECKEQHIGDHWQYTIGSPE